MDNRLWLTSLAGLLLVGCASLSPGPTAVPEVKLAAVLDEASGPVNALAWTRDGQTLASAGKGEVKLWATDQQPSLDTWKGHSSYLWGLAWSPDGTQLATVGSDGVLLLRDSKSGAVVRSFPPVSQNEFWALAWSPDGKKIAVGTDHWEVLVYSPEGGEPERFPAYGSSVQSLAWSPDGSLLAVGDLNGGIALWNTKTWEAHRQLTVESDRLSINTFGLAWSPDGKLLASAHDDGVVRLWRRDSDTAVGQVPTTGPARCVAWSPDGHWIAAGGSDGSVVLWDLKSPLAALTLAESRDPVWSVAWSPDGTFLAAGNGLPLTGGRGQVLLWSVEP